MKIIKEEITLTLNGEEIDMLKALVMLGKGKLEEIMKSNIKDRHITLQMITVEITETDKFASNLIRMI